MTGLQRPQVHDRTAVEVRELNRATRSEDELYSSVVETALERPCELPAAFRYVQVTHIDRHAVTVIDNKDGVSGEGVACRVVLLVSSSTLTALDTHRQSVHGCVKCVLTCTRATLVRGL